MKKLLSLLNVKKWLETFVMKFLASKAAKHGATALAGIVAGLATKYKLDQYGVTIDIPMFTESIMAAFGALAGMLLNWAQKVMDKDGDGLPG
jgi:phage shock protein PspC (stress-responsive transcriptional regulator)